MMRTHSSTEISVYEIACKAFGKRQLEDGSDLQDTSNLELLVSRPCKVVNTRMIGHTITVYTHKLEKA